MSKLQRVLIMAGGTGGHVFPALAVAALFQANQIDVQWLGTEKGLEARLVPEAGYPLHFITITGLRGKTFKEKLSAPWRLLQAIFQAKRMIKKINPDLVIGMGGFASGPGGIASILLGKKLVIHEQNAKPGLTNKCLAMVASKVLEAFPQTFKKRTKTETIGNPLRQEIILQTPHHKNYTQPAKLLIFGGSLGAEAINKLLPGAIAKLPSELRPEIYHQSGEKNWADTKNAYASAGIVANVVPFIQDMDKAYAWADMVLCRAGALTVSELCAVGLGGILIPYPYAVDDHQTANARFMSAEKAAYLIQQSALTEEVLVDLLKELCSSSEKRLAMGQAAYRLRTINAGERFFNICKEMCH